MLDFHMSMCLSGHEALTSIINVKGRTIFIH
jgi:hypothetical protein